MKDKSINADSMKLVYLFGKRCTDRWRIKDLTERQFSKFKEKFK